MAGDHSATKCLGFLDRYLTVWIFAAITVAVAVFGSHSGVAFAAVIGPWSRCRH